MPEKASVTTAELTGASIIIEAIDRMQGLIDLINEMMPKNNFNNHYDRTYVGDRGS